MHNIFANSSSFSENTESENEYHENDGCSSADVDGTMQVEALHFLTVLQAAWTMWPSAKYLFRYLDN
ncbi:unnamed protein product [Ceratitis capitata]|uniref:(Mediterranean fruit fly) hypothetical protein n=1 Tax=Ceratitis capitata TaxID=7213 RepID=A0A811UAH5_CERCA|nr:unnamed protein product [Ceratitis capitata]